MKFAKRIKQVQPSMTLAIDSKAKAMKAEGQDVIGFGAGEPDFDTPENIKEAGISAIRDNQTRYTPVAGIPPLKKAIVDKLKNENGLSYSPDQIVVSCGAKHSLYNLAQVLWEEEDEILIPSPYWVSYPEIVKLAGATPVTVPTIGETQFKTTPDQLLQYTSPRTRAIILNSPSNPTGSAYTKKELEALAEFVVKRDLLVISDEIYEKIVFEGFEQTSIASFSDEIKKRTVVVNGVSKAYCMTGWRIGYLAADPKIAKAVSKLQGQSTSNPASISQLAALEALTGRNDYIVEQVKEFQARRDFLVAGLNDLPGVFCNTPQGTFYSFPDFSGIYGKTWRGKEVTGSLTLSEYLLNEVKVALVPGIAFNQDRNLRMSFACSMEDLKTGLDRISAALEQLS